MVGEDVMLQSDAATEAALAATQRAIERNKTSHVRRRIPMGDVDAEKLIALAWVMAERYVDDGNKGRIDDWMKFVRLVLR